jgi:hypothetical protein
VGVVVNVGVAVAMAVLVGVLVRSMQLFRRMDTQLEFWFAVAVAQQDGYAVQVFVRHRQIGCGVAVEISHTLTARQGLCKVLNLA